MGKPRPWKPQRPEGDDEGATFVEVGVITTLAAAIIVTIAQSDIKNTINNTMREFVCLVEGPECGETWTEHDRPDKPQEYNFGIGLSSRGGDNEENKALGKELAAARGFDGREWDCLETLWHHESNWDHTAINPNGGASGIPQLHPSAHAFPPGTWTAPRSRSTGAWTTSRTGTAPPAPLGPSGRTPSRRTPAIAPTGTDPRSGEDSGTG